MRIYFPNPHSEFGLEITAYLVSSNMGISKYLHTLCVFFLPISKHSINELQIINSIFIRWMRLWGGLYHELIKLLETRYFHLKDLFLDFVDFATALNCILLRLEIPYQPQSLKQIFRNGCFLRDPGKSFLIHHDFW